MDEKKLALARRVIAALRGDTDSYKELFLEVAPEVWEICKKYFVDDEDAKAALEGTYETVAEKFADQKDPTDYVNWVKRLAHLTCAEKAAKFGGLADAEVKDLDLLTLAEYKAEKKDGVLTFATVKDLTEKVLAALPQRQKTELLLWNEGYSVTEIAKKLGISPGSVVGGLNIAKTKVEDETAAWEKDGFDYTKYAASPMSFFTRLMREKFDGSYLYELPEGDGWSWASIWDGLAGKLKWPAAGAGIAAAAGLVGKFADLDLNLPGFDWKGEAAAVELPDVDVKVPDVELPKVDVDLPDVDLKAKAADLKADIEAKLPDVDLPEVEVKAPEVDLPKVDVDLPEVEVEKPDIDLKKVGAAAAAGAAAVGAAAAAKAKDVKLPDVDLPDVELKKPDIDLPDIDLKGKAADIKAEVKEDYEEAKDKAAAVVADAEGKKKGLAGFWKWLLPLLALLVLLGILFGALRGCNKSGKVDTEVAAPAVTVAAPEAEVVAEGDLDAYLIDADVKTKTVPVTVDGTVLNIGTNDLGRFLTGLNVINNNPVAYVISHTSDAKSPLVKYAYTFYSIPELANGVLTELKYTDALGAEKSLQFKTDNGLLSEVVLADPNGDAIETAVYNYKDGMLQTVTVGDETLNYVEDTTLTKTEKDGDITKLYVGDNWLTCRYADEASVDLVTYDWNGKTGARAFAYDEAGLKTYNSFLDIMG